MTARSAQPRREKPGDDGPRWLRRISSAAPDTVVDQIRHCRAEMRRRRHRFDVPIPFPAIWASLMRSLELFGNKVLPQIRDI